MEYLYILVGTERTWEELGSLPRNNLAKIREWIRKARELYPEATIEVRIEDNLPSELR